MGPPLVPCGAYAPSGRARSFPDATWLDAVGQRLNDAHASLLNAVRAECKLEPVSLQLARMLPGHAAAGAALHEPAA